MPWVSDDLSEEYNHSDIGYKTTRYEYWNRRSSSLYRETLYITIKNNKWVQEELEEMLEKAGIISWNVTPWSSPIVIVQKIN